MKNFNTRIVHCGKVRQRREDGKLIQAAFPVYPLQTPLGESLAGSIELVEVPPITNH